MGLAMFQTFRQQPRPFYLIFMLELWERFGFYTTQGLLTLYFIRACHMSTEQAYYTFGAFSAIVYGLVALGGLIGDKILGTKRTLHLGLLFLSLGYLLLAICDHIYVSLAIIGLGNGLFKANPGNLLSRCYASDDSKLHDAFTWYYMAVNMGALAALLMGPTISAYFGYRYAYLASFIGLCLGIVQYHRQKYVFQHLIHQKDKQPISLTTWLALGLFFNLIILGASHLLTHPEFGKQILLMIIACCMIGYGVLMYREPQRIRRKMIVALILMIEAITFFTLYQQMPTSLTLFAVEHIRPHFLGITIDPQSFRALNAFWIILLSPWVIQLSAFLKHHHHALTTPHKFALGMFFSALSFLILYFTRFTADTHAMVSPFWAVVSYALNSLGELFVSALGIAMITELVPEHIRGFVIGMWFLTSSIAGFTGAFVASLTIVDTSAHAINPMSSLVLYANTFGSIGLVTLGISICLWLSAPFLSRYSHKK